MDLMAIRRRVLIGGKKVIDTSPKIAKYGYFMRNSTINIADSDWCITEWIDVINAPNRSVGIVDAFASLYGGSPPHVYRYVFSDGSTDYWYGSNDFSKYTRYIGANSKHIVRICWSLKIENLDKCYAYLKETGQIFFAGKSSPYYGYVNINDMP